MTKAGGFKANLGLRLDGTGLSNAKLGLKKGRLPATSTCLAAS
jgi:hypothetical protein